LRTHSSDVKKLGGINPLVPENQIGCIWRLGIQYSHSMFSWQNCGTSAPLYFLSCDHKEFSWWMFVLHLCGRFHILSIVVCGEEEEEEWLWLSFREDVWHSIVWRMVPKATDLRVDTFCACMALGCGAVMVVGKGDVKFWKYFVVTGLGGHWVDLTVKGVLLWGFRGEWVEPCWD
jgi:hypothetical protein